MIALTDFEFPAEYRQQRRQYLVVIQWDCGFVKAYSKQELDDIRVFDLGPTGKCYPFSAHFEHCKPVNRTARAWVGGYNPSTTKTVIYAWSIIKPLPVSTTLSKSCNAVNHD